MHIKLLRAYLTQIGIFCYAQSMKAGKTVLVVFVEIGKLVR